MNEVSSVRRGTIEMGLAMTIAGSIGVFVIESGQSPLDVVFYRCLFGAFFLWLYCCLRGLLRREHFAWRPLMLTAFAGACLVINWALLFKAYSLTSISIATIVYHVNPFIILLLGVLLFKDSFDAAKLLWTGVAFVGLIFVIGIPDELSGDYMLGIFMTLAATVLYAVSIVVAKWLQDIPPEVLACFQVSVGVVLLFPLADLGAAPQAGLQWGYLIGLGFFHTAVQYILLYGAFQKLPMALIAILSFIYPVVAVVLDYAIYEQRLQPAQWLGIAAIAVATLAVKLNWRLRRRPKTAPR
jgi:drug/metabolite transporter (DMT)-like permease